MARVWDVPLVSHHLRERPTAAEFDRVLKTTYGPDYGIVSGGGYVLPANYVAPFIGAATRQQNQLRKAQRRMHARAEGEYAKPSYRRRQKASKASRARAKARKEPMTLAKASAAISRGAQTDTPF